MRGGIYLSGFRTLLLCLALTTGCVTDEPLDRNYFAGTDKIKGGEAPSAVELSFDASENKFSWTASIDPDTGAEVREYFFYYAYNQLPVNLLDANYFEAAIGRVRSVTINSGSLKRGQHYFWVTGFDGGRESRASNVIRLDK